MTRRLPPVALTAVLALAGAPAATAAATAAAPIAVETGVSFAGFPHCVRVRMPAADLVMTTDVGPNILHFSRPGGPNLFHVAPPEPRDPKAWQPYGGHRLWVAPEVPAITYAPTNVPVAFRSTRDAVVLTAPVEPATGLVKSMTLSPLPGGVRVLHRVENRGAGPVTLAPWALSVMAGGGAAIFPQEPYAPHPTNLTPVRPLVLWSFTDMGDPRWTWGSRYVVMRQAPGNAKRIKLGLGSSLGWMAYLRGEELFVKRFDPKPGAAYPDKGCTIEAYTDETMLELETLGPLARLAPGKAVEHVERWYATRAKAPDLSEASLDAVVGPAVARTR